MALLRFRTVIGPAWEADVQAGIHAIDPTASIDPDWSVGVVEVAGTVPIESLCTALRRAGFIVEVLQERPRIVTARDILVVALQTTGLGVLGGLLLAILGGFAGYAYVGLNLSCAVVADDGPCAAQVLMIATGAGIVGTLAASLATLTAGTLRLRHMRRTGENIPFLRIW